MSPAIKKPEYTLCYFDDCFIGKKQINIIRTVVMEWNRQGEIDIRWNKMDALLAVHIIDAEISGEIESNVHTFTFDGIEYNSMSEELIKTIIQSDTTSGIIYGEPIDVELSSIWVRSVRYTDVTRNNN